MLTFEISDVAELMVYDVLNAKNLHLGQLMCKCCNPIISRRPKMLLSVILSVSVLGTRLINKLSICDHQLKNKIVFSISLIGKVFL